MAGSGDRFRDGVTPIVTVLLLIGIVMGLAITTYYFLQEQQDLVLREGQQPLVSTVNTTCEDEFVSWWIQNDAQHGIDSADVFIQEREAHTNIVELRDRSMPAEIQRGEGTGEFGFHLDGEELESGTQYDITLETDDISLDTSCTVGEEWWDSNWDYRRQIDLDTATLVSGDTAAIQLNTSQLVSEQNLQPRCQDIRTVIGDDPVPHNVSDPGACGDEEQVDVTFPVPDADAAEGSTYVYYGNLQSGIEPPWMGYIDVTYIVDTAESMFDEWTTLGDVIDSTNSDVDQQDYINLQSAVYGLNNSYNGSAATARVCMERQSLSDPLSCERYSPTIDDITQLQAYTDWLGMNLSDYDPLGEDPTESPSEGWGAGALDVIDRDNWRDTTTQILVTVGDRDTTGSSGCGDDRSQNLADDLADELDTHDITMYALHADGGCEPYAEDQMDTVGTVIDYDDAEQLSDHLLDHISSPTTNWDAMADTGEEERIRHPR